MFMLEQRIQQHFFDGADLKYQSAETLARPIAEAAAALLSAITGGGKVMACGSGAGTLLAQHLARLFTGRFERERPPLAALALAASRRCRASRSAPWACRATCCCTSTTAKATARPVISAAQGKDMTIVVLAGRGAAAFGELLAETDVLRGRAARAPRARRRAAASGAALPVRCSRFPIDGRTRHHDPFQPDAARAAAALALAAAGVLAGCAPLLVGGAVVGGTLVATDRRTTGTQVEDQSIELKARVARARRWPRWAMSTSSATTASC